MRPERNSARPFRPTAIRLAFVDRDLERRQLRRAIAAGERLFITGPPGIGKTAPVLNVLDGLEESMRSRCIYLSGIRSQRDLLEGLLTRLFDCCNEIVLSQLGGAVSFRNSFRSWLRTRTTSRLKGTLYRAMMKNGYRIFLDHSMPITRGAVKVLRELALTCEAPLYLLARAQADAGELGDLYWAGKSHLAIRPLPRAAAGQLLEQGIQAYGLDKLDLENFRAEVLRLSGSVPGALIGMCALAAQPRHHFGVKVKTRLAFIDYLTRRAECYRGDGERDAGK